LWFRLVLHQHQHHPHLFFSLFSGMNRGNRRTTMEEEEERSAMILAFVASV
jgi:hypothetical protein